MAKLKKYVKKLAENFEFETSGAMPTSLSKSEKAEVRKAQTRLRNSNDFMKNLAEHLGIERISLKDKNKALTLRRARAINSNSAYTKRGFKQWKKELASDTRLSENTIDYVLSQIDTKSMSYIENSKLRYGSNPQLDYILDDMIEMRGRLEIALDEIEKVDENLPYDIF